jgi:hypothetical protein
MPDHDIPEDIRDFISRYIESIAHLEALLLLRDNRDRPWTVAGAAERLYISQGETAKILDNLAGSGFLNRDAIGYSFDCSPAELEAPVNRLAALYRRQLIPITGLIHSKQRHLRDFADAFRWRKDS